MNKSRELVPRGTPTSTMVDGLRDGRHLICVFDTMREAVLNWRDLHWTLLHREIEHLADKDEYHAIVRAWRGSIIFTSRANLAMSDSERQNSQ